MAVTWVNKAYGREYELARFHKTKNNPLKDRYRRMMADQAITVIDRQLRDKAYLRLRERLVRASIAGDQKAIAKVELLIRDHLGEAREAYTGHKDY